MGNFKKRMKCKQLKTHYKWDKLWIWFMKSYPKKVNYDPIYETKILEKLRAIMLNFKNTEKILYNLYSTDLYLNFKYFSYCRKILFNNIDFVLSLIHSINNPKLEAEIVTTFLTQDYNCYRFEKKIKSIDLFIRYQDYMKNYLSIILIPNEYFEEIEKIEYLLNIQTKNKSEIIIYDVISKYASYIKDDDWFEKLFKLLYKFGTINTFTSAKYFYNKIKEDSPMIKNDKHYTYRGFKEFCIEIFPNFFFRKEKLLTHIEQKFKDLHNYKKYELLFLIESVFIRGISKNIFEFLFIPFPFTLKNDNTKFYL